MPDPISEQITLAIVTALEAVTVANGRQITLDVKRESHRFSRVSAADNRALVIEMDDDPVATQDQAQDKQEWIKPIVVRYFVIESENSDMPIDRRLNIGRAEIERALLLDHTQGGLAFETEMLAPERIGGNEFDAIDVWASVKYRTKYGDPYSLQ